MGLIKKHIWVYSDERIPAAVIKIANAVATIRVDHPFDLGEMQFDVPITEMEFSEPYTN
jgi:hypothetical protein